MRSITSSGVGTDESAPTLETDTAAAAAPYFTALIISPSDLKYSSVMADVNISPAAVVSTT